MVDLIGDLCIPSELIIPDRTSNPPTLSGALFLSGAKLYIVFGGQGRLITSA